MQNCMKYKFVKCPHSVALWRPLEAVNRLMVHPYRMYQVSVGLARILLISLEKVVEGGPLQSRPISTAAEPQGDRDVRVMLQSRDSEVLVRRMSRSWRANPMECSVFAQQNHRFDPDKNFRLTSFAPKGISVILSSAH